MTLDAPMSRLAREVQRLFLPTGLAPLGGAAARVRGFVLDVSRPAAWAPLGAVWQGVQAELDLPAPGIAVNGVDGLQLWFSLAEGVEAPRGLALLEHLRQRYMAEVPMHRVTMRAVPGPVPVPGPVDVDGQWSAFLAADLAPLFEETPWLDMPPTEDGQAELLSRLASIRPAVLESALERLQARPAGSAKQAVPNPRPAVGHTAHPVAAQYLLQVMHDENAPLALRVEAAKALLPYGPVR